MRIMNPKFSLELETTFSDRINDCIKTLFTHGIMTVAEKRKAEKRLAAMEARHDAKGE